MVPTNQVTVNSQEAIHPAAQAAGALVGKPWYLSKKIWLAVLSTAAMIVAAATGKTDTLPQVLHTISLIAGIASVAAPLILAVAHVDGKERDLVMAAIQVAKSLDQPDAVDVAASPIELASAQPPGPFDPTKSPTP